GGAGGCDAVHNARVRRVSNDEGRVSIDFEPEGGLRWFSNERLNRTFKTNAQQPSRPQGRGPRRDLRGYQDPHPRRGRAAFHGARLRGDELEEPHERGGREPRGGELPLRL